MRATNPYPVVAGDTLDRIMARSGHLVGLNYERTVWRFGFMRESDSAEAFSCYIQEEGFLWVLATRRTGKIVREWIGYATDLPQEYRNILDWEPNG